MVVHERVDAAGAGELRLALAGVGQAQVVVAEVGGPSRLAVTLEAGAGVGDAAPLGVSGAPELVVLGERVVLGQVERDDERLRCFAHHPRRRTLA